MKKQLKVNLPDDIKTMIGYRSTKLSTKFLVRDKTDFQHKHNVLYYGKCSNEGCKDDYVGETKRPPATSFFPVTFTNVRFSPKNFLNFSFNPFATLVKNLKAMPSASPKLLNLNQKVVFLVKSL